MKINKISQNCVYIQIPGMNTFHARIGNLAGSRFEPVGMNGAAHLTEHLTSFSLNGDSDKLDPFFFVSEINAMTFNENETYTYEPEADDPLRWRSEFRLGYPKVGTNEEADIDSETGILYEYRMEPTRYDAFIGTFRSVKPHKIYFKLSSINLTLGSNATPEIPGYPLLMLLISAGLGIILVLKKYKKNH